MLPRHHVLTAATRLGDGDDAMLALVDHKDDVARRVVGDTRRVQKGECVIGGRRDAELGGDCEVTS